MPDQSRVVIVDDSGKRHVFPAGFDPRRAASIVKQQTTPREPGLATIGDQMAAKGSAAGRFLSNFGEMVNPVTIAKGLYNTARHPIDTGAAILSQQGEQFDKAVAAGREGRYSEMVGYGGAAMLPVLGPMAAAAGEQIGSGDIAGGLGKTAGILAPFALKGVVDARTSSRAATAGTKADYLEREAANQVSRRVLSPANPRYRGQAADVAPELLKRGVQGDRIQLQQWADELIGTSSEAIDKAWDALPPNYKTPTAPIVARLNSKLKEMEFTGTPTQQGVSRSQQLSGQMDTPVGRRTAEVNPVLSDIHANLTRLRDFVKSRGATLSTDDVRVLRQQFDDAAAQAGAFAKTSGDAKLSAAGAAALDTANAFRQQIANTVPGLAPANADMHLGLTVRDILDPTKGRPSTPSVTTGATGGLHTTGALIGSAATNIPGLKAVAAFIASDLIPRIRNAQVSPQNQLRLAQDKYKLAQALKKGDQGKAKAIALNMAIYLPKGETATRSGASPSLTR